MRIKLLVCQILLALILAGCGGVAEKTTTRPMSAGQYDQKLEKQITVKLDYLLFLPEGYGQKEKKWPLILFLHGAGERGDNLARVKEYGPISFAEKQKDFPFIVIAPLCPKRQTWLSKTRDLKALLDEIKAKYTVDKQRIYLTGLSMGGFGTWELACDYPEEFAAIVPVYGGGQAWRARMLKHVPVWAFHGDKDKLVSIERSREMVNAVNARGGNAKLTIDHNAKHIGCTKTHNNKEIYEWFLSHKK
ncbi:MAG: prolyl oligopeptidase family serine peptidase [Sedimentisphaerales bacterium]|nr:prolyl oligopeptidase family serine peptidase [Sedimentisphaerales bacterium]